MLDEILDRTVVLSFDRTGFRRHARGFAPLEARALDRVLITGGTSGIGLAAAEGLADLGARLELWGRSEGRGTEAARAVGGTFRSVDLGDLPAVAAAAEEVSGPLSAVVLNAGAMPLERRLTDQGHELVWASQVLGHLLLLRVLRRRGLLTAETRVVWVSSGGMYLQRLDLRDLRADGDYQRHTVYANAKRAQVILAEALAERWPEVAHASMHPGWVQTAAVRHSMPVFYRLTRPLLRTPAQGADTIVWLVATAEGWPSGRFWFDRQTRPTHVGDRTRAPEADRAALLERVWADTGAWVPDEEAA